MKKGILIAAALALGVFAASVLAQAPTYVGSAKCKGCHSPEMRGQQYPIWEKSAHSRSFATLGTADAASLGVKDPANDPQCLKCHAPLAGDLKAEGVSCEVCHGPASAYKSMNVMRVKEDAIKAGLASYANDEAVKAKCLTCHQDAHGKSFDFAAQWAKIKHAIPGR
jgi:Zn finger protein HypA/HybF involved in hydrogenase expression